MLLFLCDVWSSCPYFSVCGGELDVNQTDEQADEQRGKGMGFGARCVTSQTQLHCCPCQSPSRRYPQHAGIICHSNMPLIPTFMDDSLYLWQYKTFCMGALTLSHTHTHTHTHTHNTHTHTLSLSLSLSLYIYIYI